MMTLIGRRVYYLSFIVFIVAYVSYLFFDRPLALFFNALKDGDFYRFARILTDAGDALYPLIIIIVVWGFFRQRNPVIAVKSLYVLWVIVVSGIIVNVLKIVFGRFRPRYLVNDGFYGFEWFEFGYRYASFPSGHSATAFGIGFALALMFPRYRVLHCLVWGFIAFTRVIVGAHFLSDVVVGSFIGALTALYLYHSYLVKKVDHGLSTTSKG